jgi:hypothetical protein
MASISAKTKRTSRVSTSTGPTASTSSGKLEKFQIEQVIHGKRRSKLSLLVELNWYSHHTHINILAITGTKVINAAEADSDNESYKYSDNEDATIGLQDTTISEDKINNLEENTTETCHANSLLIDRKSKVSKTKTVVIDDVADD